MAVDHPRSGGDLDALQLAFELVSIGELYADIVADCLTIPSCPNRTDAYSLLEAIRMGATHVLDMHLEDLQILVIGHVDRDEVDGMLWDPMPGGSGLLDQIRDRFETPRR